MIGRGLDELARRAQAAFDALTPAEQARHRRAQRVSWVYGQLRCSGRDVTYEQIEAWINEYDRRNP